VEQAVIQSPLPDELSQIQTTNNISVSDVQSLLIAVILPSLSADGKAGRSDDWLARFKMIKVSCCEAREVETRKAVDKDREENAHDIYQAADIA